MGGLIEPNIHPMLVHFAFALSLSAIFIYILGRFFPRGSRRDNTQAAGDWMLALGAIAIVATIAAGFYAYYTVAHDSPSHEAMTTHRNWAVPSGTAIIILAIWRYSKRASAPSGIFLGLLAAAALSLSVTAWWGGNIVFKYGLGVQSMPAVTGDGHDHEHGSGSVGETMTMPNGVNTGDHDNSDGHHGDAMPQAGAASGHDNSDGQHDAMPADAAQEHDNSDGHHDAPETVVPTDHDNSDGHHNNDAQSADNEAIKSIITAIQKGWEDGNGTPFRRHFLDFEGARYFESGGQNTGLNDLVENHVEPEKDSIPDLKLGLSDLEIYYEGNFAWAVASTTVRGTVVKSDRVIDNTGKQTWLFRKIDGEWKVVHTHSSSRAAR
ncbi:DUF2231 domain-containing protein [Robiginitomaculum antarcticum]|uniref:DUF2231 domain-containing protein n=1 Tax=Robiginitomaculum antarcticum TaxID=437507 RepID=UPI000369B46F|nr:DUF2231 domain-containing protein [Robiginitomaculum antarcticum]